MKVHHILIVLTTFCLSALQPAISADLTLSIQKQPKSPADIYLRSVYQEIFDALNINVTFEHYPHKRSEQVLKAHRIDGDTSRVYEYGNWYPDLIRVEEPHYIGHVLAITADLTNNVSSLENMLKSDIDICYHRGSLIVERKLNPLFKQGRFLPVSSTRNGLRTLRAGRCDVFIGVDNEILGLIGSEKFKKPPLHIRNSLYRYSSHMYLDSKHKAIASEINDMLKTMRQNNHLKQLQSESNLKLFEQN